MKPDLRSAVNGHTWYVVYLINLQRKLWSLGAAAFVSLTEAILHSLSPTAAARGQYLRGRRQHLYTHTLAWHNLHRVYIQHMKKSSGNPKYHDDPYNILSTIILSDSM